MTPVRATLPRSVRLTGAAHFTGKFDKRRQGRYFAVLVRHRAAGPARLGVVAGRHAVAAATDRSRMKRVVREVFRQSRVELGNIDIIVRVRQVASGRGLVEARNELRSLLKAAH